MTPSAGWIEFAIWIIGFAVCWRLFYFEIVKWLEDWDDALEQACFGALALLAALVWPVIVGTLIVQRAGYFRRRPTREERELALERRIKELERELNIQ
jgi:hypothetical protein